MSEVPKTINFKCPHCGSGKPLKLYRTLDDKAEYFCNVCGGTVTISKRTAMSEDKLRELSLLSDAHYLISRGAGSIGFAYDIVKWRLFDDKLANKIDMIMRDIDKIKDEIYEKIQRF
jgi:DNA-directed RNA polymerase subunit RPC12/RpoP